MACINFMTLFEKSFQMEGVATTPAIKGVKDSYIIYPSSNTKG